MEVVDPFGWHSLDPAKALEVREKLGHFEGRTWNEILVQDRHRNHPVEIYRLCREAQDRLGELALDDVDDLISLRLTGIERVWGFRDSRQPFILRLIWWDPHHQVCPSLKNHT